MGREGGDCVIPSKSGVGAGWPRGQAQRWVLVPGVGWAPLGAWSPQGQADRIQGIPPALAGTTLVEAARRILLFLILIHVN